jgi:hypothetical protein
LLVFKQLLKINLFVQITEPVDGAMTILEQEPDDLPPSDRGWLAWRFSLVAFVIDGLVWGWNDFPLAKKK